MLIFEFIMFSVSLDLVLCNLPLSTPYSYAPVFSPRSDAGKVNICSNTNTVVSSKLLMQNCQLLYIHINSLHLYVFIPSIFISAHPQLNVISGGP
jgi:hypothetical protein